MRQTGLLARWFGAEVFVWPLGSAFVRRSFLRCHFLRICIGEASGSGHLILEIEHTSHRWCTVRRRAQVAVFFASLNGIFIIWRVMPEGQVAACLLTKWARKISFLKFLLDSRATITYTHSSCWAVVQLAGRRILTPLIKVRVLAAQPTHSASPSSSRPRTTAFHAVDRGSNPLGDAK